MIGWYHNKKFRTQIFMLKIQFPILHSLFHYLIKEGLFKHHVLRNHLFKTVPWTTSLMKMKSSSITATNMARSTNSKEWNKFALRCLLFLNARKMQLCLWAQHAYTNTPILRAEQMKMWFKLGLES